MSAPRSYWVYVLASQTRGTLYIGVTGNLRERIGQHRGGELAGFTNRYRVTRLVHAEEFSDVHEAIAREKAMKKWNRAWKIDLIERGNPDWRDLRFDLHLV